MTSTKLYIKGEKSTQIIRQLSFPSAPYVWVHWCSELHDEVIRTCPGKSNFLIYFFCHPGLLWLLVHRRNLQAALGQMKNPHVGTACAVGLPWDARFSQTSDLPCSGLYGGTFSKAKFYKSMLLTNPWDKLAGPKFQLAVIGRLVCNIFAEDTHHWYIPMSSYQCISI